MAERSDDVSAQIASLYGDVDWPRARGVLHVAAIAAQPRVAIRIGPAAPRSTTDRFVLGFARARADAIVTTGAILRAEPELRHHYGDDPASQARLSDWRSDVLSRPQTPALIVLSGSGRFPLDHPAIEEARAGFVWTSPKGAARLGASVGPLSVEQDEAASASETTASAALARLIARARERGGLETISIEAGPSATAELYRDAKADVDVSGSAGADELLLSTFEAPLTPEAVGPPFVARAAIVGSLGEPVSGCARDEESGPWRFERYRRRLAGC